MATGQQSNQLPVLNIFLLNFMLRAMLVSRFLLDATANLLQYLRIWLSNHYSCNWKVEQAYQCMQIIIVLYFRSFIKLDKAVVMHCEVGECSEQLPEHIYCEIVVLNHNTEWISVRFQCLEGDAMINWNH